MDAASSPNAGAISTWSEILVPKFLRFRRVLVDGFEGHSRIPLVDHGPREGDRVLDVGCGFGETTLDLARSVGPRGHALGVDCAEGFLDVARRDAAEQGVSNATFAVADAQVDAFDGAPFDFVFSRFGTMFFQSPVAALRNIRGSMRPGARLLSVVWRKVEDNDWIALGKRVVQQHLPPPPDDGRSCGPGPFSMASEETVHEIFAKAGFVDVKLHRVDTKVQVGRTVDEAIAFQLLVGPSGEIMREAGELAEKKRPQIEADLRALIESHLTKEGVIMGSSSWSIGAKSA